MSRSTPLPYVSKPLNRTVYLMAGLSLVCLTVSMLYWYASPLVYTIFPNEGQFWCKRLTFLQISPALLASAVSMITISTLFVAIQQAEIVRALYAFRDRLAENPRRSTYLYYGAAIVLAITYAFLRFQLNYEVKTYTLEMLTRGQGNAPYQYRTLIPWTIRGLLFLVPGLVPVERLLYGIIEAASCFFLFVAFSRYLTRFFEDITTCRLLSLTLIYPLYFTHLIPNRANPIYAPYDTPAILVITLGLILLYHRRWGLYYLLFIVGTVNRETTCFLTMIYFFTAFQKDSWKSIALHCSAQLAIWLSIKHGITLFYPDQLLFTKVKGIFLNQVLLNKIFVTNPLNYLYILQMMGGIFLPAWLVGWKIDNDFAKRALLVFIPFLYGMYIVGLLAELRIFGEMIPITMLVFVLLVRRLAQESVSETKGYIREAPTGKLVPQIAGV